MIDMATIKRIPVMRATTLKTPEMIQEDVLEFMDYFWKVNDLAHMPFTVQAKLIAEAQLMAETYYHLL